MNTTELKNNIEETLLDYMELLYSIAFKLTRDAGKARSLTELTSARILRNPDGFQPGACPKPFLLKTLRNVYLAHFQDDTAVPAWVYGDVCACQKKVSECPIHAQAAFCSGCTC